MGRKATLLLVLPIRGRIRRAWGFLVNRTGCQVTPRPGSKRAPV
jgi:hypothetical protein